jgi:hypothetical protein
LAGGTDAAKFSINATTGALTFIAAPNFEVPTDANANNVYEVTVQVSDGSLTDTQAISVTVTNVNEAPVVTSNGAGNSASVNVAENETAVTTVTATDPDSPTTFTYSLNGGADAAKFSINATTGVLTFIAAPNFEVPTDANANNVYEVTVQVSDGSLTDTQAISVTVTDVNESPKFTQETVQDQSYGTSAAPKVIGRNLKSGDVVFATTVTHEDKNDTLTYELGIVTVNGAVNNEGMFSIDSTGAVKLAKPLTAALADHYALNITVRDSKSPALTDHTVLFVKFQNVVGVKGDTQGAEGGVDNISLKFQRFITGDVANEPALTVYYEVWTVETNIAGFAAEADFEAADIAALQASGIVDRVENGYTVKTRKITIPAGQAESAAVQLRIANDALANERLEIAYVFVIAPPQPAAAGQDYVPVSGVADTKKENADAYPSLKLQILGSGKVLFAPYNDAGAFNDTNLAMGNLGVHLNDINQGSLGDCYFWAAVGSLVVDDWQFVQNMFTPTYANGNLVSTKVRLFDQPVAAGGAAGTTLSIKNISTSPAVGDTVKIDGIAGGYTVASITSFDANSKTAVVELNAALPAAVTADKAVVITHAGSAIGWREIDINSNLEEGVDQSGLTGDRTAVNDFHYEVWTQMLEKAYAELKGGYNSIGNGGQTHDVWTVLKGPENSLFYATSSFGGAAPGDAMIQKMKDIIDAGGQVGLWVKAHPNSSSPDATSITVPNIVLPAETLQGGLVYGSHVYIIKSDGFKTDATGKLIAVQLYNPHGADAVHPWVSADLLPQIAEGIYELK